jgi:hypothetical protein
VRLAIAAHSTRLLPRALVPFVHGVALPPATLRKRRGGANDEVGGDHARPWGSSLQHLSCPLLVEPTPSLEEERDASGPDLPLLSTASQGFYKVLSRQWALLTLLTVAVAGVLAAAIVWLHGERVGVVNRRVSWRRGTPSPPYLSASPGLTFKVASSDVSVEPPTSRLTEKVAWATKPGWRYW